MARCAKSRATLEGSIRSSSSSGFSRDDRIGRKLRNLHGLGAGRQQVAGQAEPLAQHFLGVRPDETRRQPRGVGRAEHGADRGAGDDLGLEAQLVEHLQHQDMREPARAAPAQRQRDRRPRGGQRRLARLQGLCRGVMGVMGAEYAPRASRLPQRDGGRGRRNLDMRCAAIPRSRASPQGGGTCAARMATIIVRRSWTRGTAGARPACPAGFPRPGNARNSTAAPVDVRAPGPPDLERVAWPR